MSISTSEELEPRREAAPIEDLLHKDQNVLVQVAKESLGTKGARITSFISLPGRLSRLHAAGAPHRRLAPHPRRPRARAPARGAALR